MQVLCTYILLLVALSYFFNVFQCSQQTFFNVSIIFTHTHIRARQTFKPSSPHNSHISLALALWWSNGVDQTLGTRRTLVCAFSFTPATPMAQRLIIYHNSFISCLMAGSIHTHAHAGSRQANRLVPFCLHARAQPSFSAPQRLYVCVHEWERAACVLFCTHCHLWIAAYAAGRLLFCFFFVFCFFNNLAYKIFVLRGARRWQS